MTTTTADILVDAIQDWGVEVIFGLPGDGINGIMESTSDVFARRLPLPSDSDLLKAAEVRASSTNSRTS